MKDVNERNTMVEILSATVFGVNTVVDITTIQLLHGSREVCKDLLFYITYKEAGIIWAHSGIHNNVRDLLIKFTILYYGMRYGL